MKSEWVILLVSAFTDAIISGGTSLASAMVATGSIQVPSAAVMILSAIGAAVAAARTIQQALKATPAATAALRGDPPPPKV